MSKTQNSSSRLRWWCFQAPWSEADPQWKQSLETLLADPKIRTQVDFVSWNRDEVPEVDQASQAFVQTLSGHSGWPCHLFLAPDGTALFASGAVEPQALASLLRQLLVAWTLDPEALIEEGRRQRRRFEELDPLQWGRRPQLEDESALVSKANLQRLLTPLEQSLNFERGWVGQQNVFQTPGVYRSLLAFEDLRRWGELALVRLARSPLADVVGGGFFRSLEKDQVATEKLLQENAELLEVYLEAGLSNKRSFLYQVAHETLDFLVEFASLGASREFYQFSAADLLAALPAPQRQATKLFFGLSSEPRLPEIATELEALVPGTGLEPVDLHLQLLDSRRRLKEHRSLQRARLAPLAFPEGPVSQWTALRALARASFEMDLPQVFDQVRERYEALAPLPVEGPRARWSRARAELALARVAASTQESAWSRELIGQVETQVAAVNEPWEAITYETPFAGKRLDLCDFVGASAASLYVETLLDLRGLQQQGMEGPMGLPVSARDALAHYLKAARPLGVHAASLYAALARGLGTC